MSTSINSPQADADEYYEPRPTASAKAIQYLVDLSRDKTPHVAEADIRAWAFKVDRSQVSEKIDWLKGLPVVAPLGCQNSEHAHLGEHEHMEFCTPIASLAAMASIDRQIKIAAPERLERHGVPAGRYAVTGEDGQTVFVVVEIPEDGKWAGRIFVKIQVSDSQMRTSRPVANALLGKIASAGLKESMLRYGREIGKCGHCHRTLTNEESREYGVGPVCRENLGW